MNGKGKISEGKPREGTTTKTEGKKWKKKGRVNRGKWNVKSEGMGNREWTRDK